VHRKVFARNIAADNGISPSEMVVGVSLAAATAIVKTNTSRYYMFGDMSAVLVGSNFVAMDASSPYQFAVEAYLPGKKFALLSAFSSTAAVTDGCDYLIPAVNNLTIPAVADPCGVPTRILGYNIFLQLTKIVLVQMHMAY
jgi:hypothetical protein